MAESEKRYIGVAEAALYDAIREGPHSERLKGALEDDVLWLADCARVMVALMRYARHEEGCKGYGACTCGRDAVMDEALKLGAE
jgi:hypothetical protein